MNIVKRTAALFGAVLLLAAAAGMPQAHAEGKTQAFDVLHANPALRTGLLPNPTAAERVAFRHRLEHAGASWLRLTFADVKLGDGDYIRIVSPETGDEQVLGNTEPQYGDPSFEGRMLSARFAGERLDVELHLAPGSAGAGFTLEDVLVAKGRPIVIQSICGPNDDRALVANDPCAVRIVDSQGGWGSGFMIGPNCMLTANHVMTAGPWTIERNVPASNATTGAITPAGAADAFPLANLMGSTTSGSTAAGNDWAVVVVPNNAAGAPGQGCNPTFNCAFSNDCTGTTSLTTTGFGTDSRNARNGALQTHSGPCVPAAMGAPATDFRYRVDTTPNGSGSRVTDQNGAIVGIHQRGGCNGDNPETGANGGTTLNAPGLRAAIQARCMINICGPVGVEEKTWGNVKVIYR